MKNPFVVVPSREAAGKIEGDHHQNFAYRMDNREQQAKGEHLFARRKPLFVFFFSINAPMVAKII